MPHVIEKNSTARCIKSLCTAQARNKQCAVRLTRADRTAHLVVAKLSGKTLCDCTGYWWIVRRC